MAYPYKNPGSYFFLPFFFVVFFPAAFVLPFFFAIFKPP